MRRISFSFALLLPLAAACGRLDDTRTTESFSIENELEKLQGDWGPVKPAKAGAVPLAFNKDTLQVSYMSFSAIGAMGQPHEATAKFELKKLGEKRVITPVGQSKWASSITYRFDGDTLVIEDGEFDLESLGKVPLKGEWKRRPRGEVP